MVKRASFLSSSFLILFSFVQLSTGDFGVVHLGRAIYDTPSDSILWDLFFLFSFVFASRVASRIIFVSSMIMAALFWPLVEGERKGWG